MIERGGVDTKLPDDGGDDYRIDARGLDYPESGVRLSGFGGTSGHWSGHSHPISLKCFVNRDHIVGWPIDYSEYIGYVADAAQWLNIAPFEKTHTPTSLETGIFSANENLSIDRFHLSDPIARLGMSARDEVKKSEDIWLLHDTRVVELVLNRDTARIDHVKVESRDKSSTSISADTIVLASGGIETARLMLASSRNYSKGNPLGGGPNQLTGKYFHEHILMSPIEIFFDSKADLSDTRVHIGPRGETEIAMWRPTDRFIECNDLARFGVSFFNPVQPIQPDFEDWSARLFGRGMLYLRSSPIFQFEQQPILDSYVGLSDMNDSSGYPIAALNWRISHDDYERFRRSILMFSGLVSQHGNARVRVKPEIVGEDYAKWDVGVGAHHMGTMRMASNEKEGVVDTNCKVFGLANLYVAGSAVFPSGDYVNPTMNIVALTDRLCDHLLAKRGTSPHLMTFGVGKSGNKALRDGWSTPEQDGIWTLGGAGSVIELPRNIKEGITIYGHAFDPAGRTTLVDISLDGKQLYNGAAQDILNKVIKVTQPVRGNLLVIKTINPKSPEELDLSSDIRKLGVFVQSVWVR